MAVLANGARLVFGVGVAALLLACGAAQQPAPRPSTRPQSAQWTPPAENMQVTGLMGTIPERKIHATLEPLLPKFARCFARGAQEVEFIGGHLEFYFRVGLDGRVEWVYPRASDVGHRATEQCALDIAKGAHFPEPKGGGAAEVTWGFDMDAPDGVRPAVAWGATRVESARTALRALRESCSLQRGTLLVTVYVGPGGKVMAAGASADSLASAGQIDCVVEAVRGFTLPDPGSYAAKVSFRVP